MAQLLTERERAPSVQLLSELSDEADQQLESGTLLWLASRSALRVSDADLRRSLACAAAVVVRRGNLRCCCCCCSGGDLLRHGGTQGVS